jgi:nitrogen fixation protein NifU and related proteins
VSDLGKLYQEVILTHHRAPRHATALSEPTHSANGNNPLCGDRVSLTLRVGQGRLLEAGCEVKGCAICRAAGSMMADAILGLELTEVVSLSQRFLLALAETPPDAEAPRVEPAERADDWGPLAALLEARRFPNRRRCASLSWEVLARALSA